MFVSILASADGSSTKKTIIMGENGKVKDAVNKWFLQKHSQGQPKSGIVLREKALIFSEKLGRDPQS
jgi:hypothetical protein